MAKNDKDPRMTPRTSGTCTVRALYHSGLESAVVSGRTCRITRVGYILRLNYGKAIGIRTFDILTESLTRLDVNI